MSPIRTLFSSNHSGHQPTIEFMHGQQVPYFEKPSRIDEILTALQTAGLITLETPSLQVNKKEIGQTHDPAMLDYLQELSSNVRQQVQGDFAIYHMVEALPEDVYYYESVFPKRSGDARARKFYIYDGTCPVGKNTWDAVLHSANLAYVGAQELLKGEKKLFALCRPPGHHAGRDFMGGYCFINNAAVAANALKAKGKVAILDVDYHHGNGTQDIFYRDGEVLFVSIHADPLQDYPYYCGFAEERGEGAGEGANLNLPLPHGATPTQFMQALEKALSAIRDFGAQSLVVSLGWDTFKDDPIAQFNLDMGDYTEMGRMIDALGLPTLYVQEGGYAIHALGEMAVAFFNGVNG